MGETSRRRGLSASIWSQRQMNPHLNIVSRLLFACSLAAERDFFPPAVNVGAPASPSADVAASPTTECPVETEADGGFLRGAQMSSFGRKRKLRNTHDISTCLCGKSAAPPTGRMADNVPDNVVCCRIPRCETKWVSSNMFCTQVY